MKRLLCIVMVALLMITAAAYAEPAGQQAQTTAQETVEERLYRMIPVLDSFARQMGLDGEVTYDANDPQFFWTQMYFLGINWGLENALVRQADGQMIIPASVMQEYAAASFHGLGSLPDIPPSVTEIRFDAALNSYRLNMSDAAQTYIVIERYATDTDVSLLVGMGLYDAGTATRLGGLLVQLADSASPGSALPYGIKNAQMESSGDFAGLTATTCHIRHVDEILPYAATPEPAATPTPVVQPVATKAPTAAPASSEEYPRLSTGSRGDSVKALQRRLNELGYNCGSSDGVFGSNTKRAVRYFQDAIGTNQDGVATNALQRKLYASSAPEFVLYVQLRKGSSGVRVEKLQTRLREWGYLAEPTDGDYGARTAEAVKLFQKKAGLKVDGIAGTRTQSALFKKNAPRCDEYITLKKGDTGIRVKEMQECLHKLGFLSKKANSAYDNDTVKAVEAFLKALGETGNGKTADPKLLEKLFKYVHPTPTPAPTAAPTPAPEATATPVPEATATPAPEATATPEPTSEPTATPEPTPEPTATPTPTPEPTATPEPPPAPAQAISDDQLHAFTDALNTALGTSHNSVDAVKWLQHKLSITENGIYDDATKSAVSAYQTNNGLSATGIADAEVIGKLSV